MQILFIIYFIAELFVIVSFGAEFGFFALLLEFALSALFGLFIISSQHRIMFESYGRIFHQGESIKNFLSRSFFRLIGGILLFLPGILSDIVGIVFFAISLFIAASAPKNSQNPQSNFPGDETIIDAEIIDSHDIIEQK